MRTNKHARACARTNTQTLHLPNILRLPLHVLHGGVCVGLWKQLGLIIDVLHFNQFHHSVRLIKVSAMLPGAVYVWGCEWIKKKKCVWDGRYMCVFLLLGAPCSILYLKIHGNSLFQEQEMRDGPFLSLLHARSRLLFLFLSFPHFVCLSLLLTPSPRSPQAGS